MRQAYSAHTKGTHAKKIPTAHAIAKTSASPTLDVQHTTNLVKKIVSGQGKHARLKAIKNLRSATTTTADGPRRESGEKVGYLSEEQPDAAIQSESLLWLPDASAGLPRRPFGPPRNDVKSEIAWLQARALGNTGKHAGTNFIAIMKGKHKIGPTQALHYLMRSAPFSLDLPSNT
jgi:hypothetical protein